MRRRRSSSRYTKVGRSTSALLPTRLRSTKTRTNTAIRTSRTANPANSLGRRPQGKHAVALSAAGHTAGRGSSDVGCGDLSEQHRNTVEQRPRYHGPQLEAKLPDQRNCITSSAAQPGWVQHEQRQVGNLRKSREEFVWS